MCAPQVSPVWYRNLLGQQKPHASERHRDGSWEQGQGWRLACFLEASRRPGISSPPKKASNGLPPSGVCVRGWIYGWEGTWSCGSMANTQRDENQRALCGMIYAPKSCSGLGNVWGSRCLNPGEVSAHHCIGLMLLSESSCGFSSPTLRFGGLNLRGLHLWAWGRVVFLTYLPTAVGWQFSA